MYCKYCGTLLRENAGFCHKCGQPVPPTKQDVVYVEEKPMESLMDNTTVIALTFCVLVIAIVTIVCTSLITKDIPSKDQLQGNVVVREVL